MQPLAADHLVLEIAADRAGRLEPRDIAAAFFRDRSNRRLRNRPSAAAGRPPRRSASHWRSAKSSGTCCAVAEAAGVADRMAARRQRLGARLHHRQRAADVPDIVKHDRIAGHVQRGEGFELAVMISSLIPARGPVAATVRSSPRRDPGSRRSGHNPRPAGRGFRCPWPPGRRSSRRDRRRAD